MAIIVALISGVMFPSLALAEGLPFQTNADLLEKAMSGPIATIISLVGIVGCGAMLIFGGELSGFARTMVFLVLVISVIVQAGAIVRVLQGETGGSPNVTVTTMR
ncbi:TrbC/VirB2 family protein [Luteibacter aegosomatis]|uniref:TrbC/VirB2 family protein n=1 Tax=Luteibacter aegosomatis TaxID=2911537 RepID=UPI001FFC034B|nr:TrbC/VirB2 family protein [Luteibacter aegosomatis]